MYEWKWKQLHLENQEQTMEEAPTSSHQLPRPNHISSTIIMCDPAVTETKTFLKTFLITGAVYQLKTGRKLQKVLIILILIYNIIWNLLYILRWKLYSNSSNMWCATCSTYAAKTNSSPSNLSARPWHKSMIDNKSVVSYALQIPEQRKCQPAHWMWLTLFGEISWDITVSVAYRLCCITAGEVCLCAWACAGLKEEKFVRVSMHL